MDLLAVGWIKLFVALHVTNRVLHEGEKKNRQCTVDSYIIPSVPCVYSVSEIFKNPLFGCMTCSEQIVFL